MTDGGNPGDAGPTGALDVDDPTDGIDIDDSADGIDVDSDGTELAVGPDAFEQAGSGLEVAVVGAGAVGATAAYDLSRRGADVTVYERGSIAAGSTGRAAGICYDAFADPLDADIGAEAIERFRRLSGEDTFPFVECPYVWLAREGDDRRADAIRDRVRRMQERGTVAVEMDADALGDRFPALRTDDVAVAGVAGAAGYADPARYAACLAAAANGNGATLETDARAGVRGGPPRVVTGEGSRVDGRGNRTGRVGTRSAGRRSGDEREFDAVLVAAGAHTRRVLESAGVDLAMKPYRVQALVGAADLEGPTCYDATAGFYARPHPDGVLAGDGTEEVEADPDDWNREADSGFATDLATRVEHRFPAADLGVDRAWAGLCTATPDRDPLVGRVREGLYVATGFQGHGFMRAPAIGRRVADEIVGGGGIEAFDPTRFTGDEAFAIAEGMRLE